MERFIIKRSVLLTTKTLSTLITSACCNTMKLDLNIGLAPGAVFGGAPLCPLRVLATLEQAGFVILKFRLDVSTTEETFVASVTPPSWCRDIEHVKTVIYSLAVCLRQEAVAWRSDAYDFAAGFLTGPHTAGWGDFNPAFFILP